MFQICLPKWIILLIRHWEFGSSAKSRSKNILTNQSNMKEAPKLFPPTQRIWDSMKFGPEKWIIDSITGNFYRLKDVPVGQVLRAALISFCSLIGYAVGQRWCHWNCLMSALCTSPLFSFSTILQTANAFIIFSSSNSFCIILICFKSFLFWWLRKSKSSILPLPFGLES